MLSQSQKVNNYNMSQNSRINKIKKTTIELLEASMTNSQSIKFNAPAKKRREEFKTSKSTTAL